MSSVAGRDGEENTSTFSFFGRGRIVFFFFGLTEVTTYLLDGYGTGRKTSGEERYYSSGRRRAVIYELYDDRRRR